MDIRACKYCAKQFTPSLALASFYEKMKLPDVSVCGECRLSRVAAFVNVHSLHRRECGLCKRPIVTMYHADDPAPVFCNECWQGDAWDASAHAQAFDPSIPFFEQWRSLYMKVPRPALRKVQMTDSEYVNFSVQGSHCYLSYSVLRGENIRYSENIDDSKNCGDCLCVKGLEWCHENMDSVKNYACAYMAESRNCIDSRFLFDCANCQDCFMSANLRNKRHVFRGEQLSKEEYEERLARESFGSHAAVESLKQEFAALRQNALHRYADITNSPQSTGNHILNSRSVQNAFFVTDGEIVIESIRVPSVKELANCLYIAGSESLFSCIGCSLGSHQLRSCMFSMGSRDADYSAFCLNCQDVFGCVGLRNKKYCVLNAQYSKEEYFELVTQIRTQMDAIPYVDATGASYGYGDFFPVEFSPFGYNETVGNDYFPKTKADCAAQAFNWHEAAKRSYPVTHVAQDLPDDISDADDSLAGAVVECLHKGECADQCASAFRVFGEDIAFYKKMNVPLPRLCPNCRFYERFTHRPPARLWQRSCMCAQEGHDHTGKCPNEFETSYAPERPELIYCESCYQQEVL